MTNSKKPLPYGSWPSPFTSSLVAGKNRSFTELSVDQGNIYWLERRPEEQGRTVLVKWNEQAGLQDVTPPPFSIGTKVHEYGGGAYSVRNNKIIFSDQRSGGVWFIDQDQEPTLLFQDDTYRFADFCITDHFVICIAEEHKHNTVNNSIVALSLTTSHQKKTLVKGADFYSSPRLSNNQKHLVWIEWDHPFMPWESTRLCMADLDHTLSILKKRVLAGHEGKDALIEPNWSQDDHLFVCSDRSEWWNLYKVDLNTNQLMPVAPMQAEIGLPQWVFGQKSWYECLDGYLIARRIINGIPEIISIDQEAIQILDFDYPDACPVPMSKGCFAWINASTHQPTEIIYQKENKRQVIRSAMTINISIKTISIGENITFPTQDQSQAHGFFYPPTNETYCGLNNELPPLLVLAHGGPTGQSFNSFSPRIQYWTSRGFAVVDVNYRGSTGFGKPYRQALTQQWGVLDVQDCIDACHYLIDQNKVDPKRIVIRGSSAGGFTVLSALIQSSIFAAGSCLYGVGDLIALAKETHKFESHYLTGLIGRYPEEEHIYQERSPLTHIHNLKCPLIVFQGLQDKVVPPSQADQIVTVLKDNHIPYAYYRFPEEGHGFRQEATIKAVLDLELSFFGKILNFKPSRIDKEVLIHS